MKGIYCIRNKVDGKAYVGQSMSIENRVEEHRYRYNRKHSNSYDSLLYRAMRKYGLESFEFFILESSEYFTRDDLNKLEVHYVEELDTFGPNGYNMNRGGRYTSGKKLFDEKDILKIKEELEKDLLSLSEIAEKYSCSIGIISLINSGASWNWVGDYNYPIKDTSPGRPGEKNPNSIASDEDVIRLRERFTKETLEEIYQDMEVPLSRSALKKILYGHSFRHLPVYKKRKKKWFLDETCIDYPRLEE